MSRKNLNIAMLCVHSSPVGELGTAYTGGMSVYVRELAAALASQGHWVDIFTRCADVDSTLSGAPVHTRLSDRVRLIYLPAGATGSVSVSQLYPYLAQFRDAFLDHVATCRRSYDLVHSHYWLSGEVGQQVHAALDIPHVMTFHTLGNVKQHSGARETVSARRLGVERELVRTCDRLLVPSQRERENLVRYYGALPADIRVVSCGVNLRRFGILNKARARQVLGLDDREPVALYVGRFAPVKGLENLIAAMGRLAADPLPLLMLVGGDGAQSAAHCELERKARALNLQEQIIFAGRVPQERLDFYYGAADLLVVPSYYESFGLVALEALACGRPVVSTDVGDMPTLIQSGRTGYVVGDPSVDGLADGIDKVLARANGLLAPESIRRTVEHLDWRLVACEVGRVYTQLVG